MREELVLALEEQVVRLIAAYQQLQTEHTVLTARADELENRQQLASARIDALLQKVQSL